MGAPVGNQNARKAKIWRDAILKALDEYHDDQVKQGEALFHIALVTVRDAIAGDAKAREEIGNRVEGKPAQAVTLAGDPDNPVHTVQKIERRIVDANASD